MAANTAADLVVVAAADATAKKIFLSNVPLFQPTVRHCRPLVTASTSNIQLFVCQI